MTPLVSTIVELASRVRPRGTPAIQKIDTFFEELPNSPVEPTWIKEGEPMARAVTLATSPDGTMTTGLWECTAGRFKWTYWVDEVVLILEGAVTVQDAGDGSILTLRRGDAALFPFGSTAHWHIERFVRKFFVVRMPAVSSPVARLRRAVGL